MPRIVNRPHVLEAVELSAREYDELQRVLRELATSPRSASRALARQINSVISEATGRALSQMWAKRKPYQTKGPSPCG